MELLDQRGGGGAAAMLPKPRERLGARRREREVYITTAREMRKTRMVRMAMLSPNMPSA